MNRLVLGLCALLAGGVMSCGEADKLFDCQSVCDKYKTCFDKDYNVGMCRSQCKAKADADKEYQKKADVCEACIDDRSCASATFSCATQCAGIVGPTNG